ncbi:rod shape-determining protein [Streptomyces sp. NPDC048258]|uniref:rod shape-determining protein n=1 Tax=Streptomyces sp. NPDC048258 TaxID=3365527 RepID=UPI003716B8F5
MPQASINTTASSRDIGVDLGTANTLVYARGHGIVLNEPSVVAVKAGTTTALAVGAEAKEAIIAAVRATLEDCPPELSGDVMEHGIVLTGGGALLPGLDLRMASATGIPVFVADNPLDCVALGSGRCVEDLDTLGGLLAPAKP